MPDKTVCIHVEARGPVQAAEIVLGESLVTQGKPGNVRAVVWKLAEDYTPVSLALFLQNSPRVSKCGILYFGQHPLRLDLSVAHHKHDSP